MGEASSEALPAWAKLQAKPCPVQIKETNKPMDVRCPNKIKLVQLVKDVPYVVCFPNLLKLYGYIVIPAF